MKKNSSENIELRNLRHKHLNKQVCVEGLITQTSDVRPEAVSAKFECPDCGNIITIKQTGTRFREPKCPCGRKEDFKLIDKELVDIKRIVLEEIRKIPKWDYQRKISVFLRQPLTDPEMEDQTRPGRKVKVTGTLETIQIPHSQGGLSRRFDIVINADHLEQI